MHFPHGSPLELTLLKKPAALSCTFAFFISLDFALALAFILALALTLSMTLPSVFIIPRDVRGHHMSRVADTVSE